MSDMRQKTSPVSYIVVLVALTAIALGAIFPFLYMALISLTQKTMLNFKFDVAEFSLLNYSRVFKNFNLLVNFRNSVIVTVSACILNCLISSMAAYAFAKKRFPFRDKLFFAYLATLMIPGQVTLIPVFVIIKSMGLMNTYPALIFSRVGSSLKFRTISSLNC